MQHKFSYLVLSALTISANAIPQPRNRLSFRADGPATITQLDTSPASRAEEVAANRAGYLYAPSLMGEASFHLGGTLGVARIESDLESWLVDRNIVNASLNADVGVASAAINAVSITVLSRDGCLLTWWI